MAPKKSPHPKQATPVEEPEAISARLDLDLVSESQRCVHQLIQKQVEKTPAAPAIFFQHQVTTYRELDERANQLAGYLRAQGVGPESLVGVWMERSPDLIVAILAILKAGGAYLPFDHKLPLERIQLITQIAQPKLIISEKRLAAALIGQIQFPTLLFDTDWPRLAAGYPTLPPENRSTLNDLASVLFTSGTTGRPKGVALPQRSARGLVDWIGQTFTAQELSGVLGGTSVGFDMSGFEIFGTLAWGGCLVLVDHALELLDDTGEHPITLINTVPSTLAALWRAGGIPPTVKTVLLAGEVLSADLVDALYRLPGLERVFDSYGPTETSYATLSLRCPGERANIGQPLPGWQVYVLDERGAPVAPGLAGEVYIGGVGLARGYYAQPDLTAERFLPNPFGKPGEFFYRTGDQARWLETGNLEYLGRLDQQIKLRGFRIEPGEVEAVLKTHPQVREALVTLRADRLGEPQLVGYFLAAEGVAPGGAELRAYLLQKLPAYLVPAVLVCLEAFPLTLNGKIDRQALPAPRFETQAGAEDRVPQTRHEKILVEIWQAVLNCEGIGRQANFFELGGDSLLATQVISRLRTAFGYPVPLSTIFAEPTLAGLAAQLERIPLEAEKAEEPELRPVARQAHMPLSFAQKRFWFLDQYEPGSALYSIAEVYRLAGPLDCARLEKSLAEIVRRHEALRTTFETQAGEPEQIIQPDSNFSLLKIDLSALPENERETEARRLAAEIARQPFDLAESVFRVGLLELAREAHLLVVSFQHIAADGWSLRIFERELSALYRAYSQGEPSPLADLPIQPVDYAVWQQAWLEQAGQKHQLDYWRKQLAEAPVLELASEKLRPVVDTHRGEKQVFLLSETTTRALKKLAQAEQASLFMVLLAAFKVLLYRETGEVDLLVGIPIAGRRQAEVENLIGCFLNTLVLRTDLSGQPTFRQLVGRVRQVALDAYANQDLPFEKLLSELQPRRDLGRSPYFQILFNMLSREATALTLPGLRVEPIPLEARLAPFDLTVYVSESNPGLEFAFLYNREVFTFQQLERLLQHFQILLEGVALDPEQAIAHIPVVTAVERETVLARDRRVRPQNAFRPFLLEETEQTIQSRFEAQVRRNPDKIAVKTQDSEWTYRQLNANANRVARAILDAGGPGPERVAVLFEQGAPLIAALLGILKAGKTYLPLDPLYPVERLTNLLTAAEARRVVTNSQNRSLAAAVVGAQAWLVNFDQLDPELPDGDLQLEVAPESLAYLLYTSGSTGQPKGVMQNQRNVLTHIRNYTNQLHLGAEDRLLMLAADTVDAAVMDIFGAVLNGATVYPFDLREQGFEAARDWMLAQAITVYHSTPTVYRHFLEALNGTENFADLRLVVLGGEAATRQDVELYQQHFPPTCLLVSGYGLTESTLGLQYFADHETRLTRPAVPLGNPVAGIEVSLRDPAGQEGAILGEIVLRGAQLALGYWGQPELTEKAFLPDPEHPGQHLYLTGDFARRLPDGQLEFIGRRDQQVKLRGYRVELGEIESALKTYPGLQDAIVLAREDAPGQPRLVGYVIPRTGASVTEPQLRAYLRGKLPAYLLPAAYVFMEQFPLTPSGKLLRRGLPAPVSPVASAADELPETELQRDLRQMWLKLLGLPMVGLDENFFDLGGESLLAVRLMGMIEHEMGLRLPVVELFRAPTLRQLAQAIQEKQPAPLPWTPLVCFQTGQGTPLFILHNQMSAMYLARELRGPWPVYGLEPAGLEVGSEPDTSVEQMAERYLAAMRTVQPTGPYRLAGFCAGGVVAYEAACQLRAAGQTVELVLELDGQVNQLKQHSWRYWLKILAANLPRWLRTYLLEMDSAQVLQRLKKRLREHRARLRNEAFERERVLADPQVDEAFRRRWQTHVHLLSCATHAYRPRPYPGRVTVFNPTWISPLRWLLQPSDPTQGWKKLALGGVDFYDFPGEHTSYYRPPHLAAVAATLKAILEKLDAEAETHPAP